MMAHVEFGLLLPRPPPRLCLLTGSVSAHGGKAAGKAKWHTIVSQMEAIFTGSQTNWTPLPVHLLFLPEPYMEVTHVAGYVVETYS